MQPLEATAAAAQHAIVDEFGMLSDWSERYQYLIDLGLSRHLSPTRSNGLHAMLARIKHHAAHAARA